MTDLKPDELAELKALEAAATPELWVGWTSMIGDEVLHPVGIEAGGSDRMIGAFASLSDRELVRLLRNHAKDLLKMAEENEALRARIKSLEAERRDANAVWIADCKGVVVPAPPATASRCGYCDRPIAECQRRLDDTGGKDG